MIERFTKIATTVDEMPQAWAFIMEHLDEVGPHASVAISPYLVDGTDVRKFAVSVSATVEQ